MVTKSDSISWIENLRRGVSALILHPFLPLKNFKFSYSCLFSSHSYCRVDREELIRYSDKDNSQYSKIHPPTDNLFRKFSRSIFHALDISTNLLEKDRTYLHKPEENRIPKKLLEFFRHISKRMIHEPGCAFLVAQLLMCSIILTYFLIKDLKKLAGFFIKKRYKE